jgi:excisionase family DNA binding protein
MSDAVLMRDAEAIRRSLAGRGDEVSVSLSRETAEYVARVVEARAEGREVIVARGLDEVTPSEAASILGVSRPQVRKLMERGMVPFRKVGAHHRIPVGALRAWEAGERERRERALDRLADLQNELGLVE